MLEGKKILVTGPAGQIAFPLASTLAQSNEVWGIARFTDPAGRDKVEAAGIRAHAADLATGDFGGLPDDFDYVLHLATYRSGGLDYDQALRVNAEGTQALLAHCRSSGGVLVMSTSEVYKPQADPHHKYSESDPLGDSNSLIDPTYSVSKISQEAVARSCARAYGIPVVIARMNASYGDNGGLLAYHLDWILSGKPVMVKWDPAMYSPIHEDDIFGQTEALLAAASVPATVVNWAGDEPVSAQEWCAYMGELTGGAPDVTVREVPGGIRGVVNDVSRRSSITGPCQVPWRHGVERLVEHRLGNGSVDASVYAKSARLMSAFESPPAKPTR
jgi:nucleoside-diphosphate-sugar epimerase